jgi:predicted metal-dependent phosphoesterase TrpH
LIVDFHSHTCESDGSLSPQALADFMIERGVEAFSISDHDTLAAYARFEPPASARVIAGIEINTTWHNNEVHVLGYGMRLDDSAFDALLVRNRASRRARVEKMIEQLREAGYGISMADIEREANGGQALGRPHVGKALIRAGHFSTIDAAFRSLLYGGRAGYVPSTYITPLEAITAIHAAGGLAVLAHPGRIRNQRLIEDLIEMGIDGLEVFYPRHDAEDVARFREICARNHLVMTAGADFHDIRYNTRGVGIEVDARDITPFLETVVA